MANEFRVKNGLIVADSSLTTGGVLTLDNGADESVVIGATGGTGYSTASFYGDTGSYIDFAKDTGSSTFPDYDFRISSTGPGGTLASATNGDISILPHGSGKVILDQHSWPVADGNANEVLATDSNGNLSWITASGIAGGVTLSGSTNNTIATVTGGNALIGETNLTFDGSTLTVDNTLALTGDGPSTPSAGTVHLGEYSDALEVQTAHGYVRVGPTSTGWGHITTDRGKFYMNKPLVLSGGSTTGAAYNLSSYNDEDLVLATQSGTENRITIKSDTGNVGIGTTAPSNPLHVEGDALFTNTMVETTLDGAILSGATTIDLTDASAFASAGYGAINDADQFQWTGKSSNQLTGVSGIAAGYADDTKVTHSTDAAILTLRTIGGPASAQQTQLKLEADDYRGAGIVFDSSGSASTYSPWFTGRPYASTGFSVGYHASAPETLANSALFIDTSKNVGIGTTTTSAQHPDATLYVKGGIDFSESTSASEGSTPAITQWSTDAAAQDLAIGARSGTGEVLFFTGNAGSAGDWGASSNAERMRITHDGNVGINQTSPDKWLHITTKTTSGGEFALILDRPQQLATAAVGIDFQLGDSASATAQQSYAHLFGVIEDPANTGEDGAMTFWTAKDGVPAEKMRLTSDGNLGIGTDSPSEALHIRSSSDHPLVLENDQNAAYVGIQFSDHATGSYAQKGELRFNHADSLSDGAGASFHFTSTESLNVIMPRLSIKHTLPSNDATTLSGAEVFKVDSIDDQSTSGGPGFQIRLESTNDHNAANYERVFMGDGGGMRVKNKFGNWGFSEWWLAGNADGFKPIMGLAAGGSSSAGAAQDGILTLYSTTSAWGNNAWSPSNNTAKVVLDAGGDSYFTGGNLGIGTTSPNQKLTVEGTISLKEQADANADTAAYGQLWVNTATPNELFFTTDAGDDIQLTSGTSHAGAGSSIDISGFTDIGESIADADLLMIDNGANGTTRKTTMARVKTWIGDNVSELRMRDARADGDITPDGHAAYSASFHFTDDMPDTGNSWDGVMTLKGWGNSYSAWQLFSSAQSDAGADKETNQLFYRSGEDTTWGSVRRVLLEEGVTGRVAIGHNAPDQKLHIEGGSILVDAYNAATTTLASNYTDNDLTLVLTDASEFATKGTGTINGVEFTWTNKSSNTLTVPDLGANYTAGVTVVADTGLFFRDGYETDVQPSITLYDKDNSGASRDDLSINAANAIRFQINDAAEMLLTDGKVGIGTTIPTSPSGVNTFLHIQSASHAGIVLEDTGGSSAWDVYAVDNNLKFKYSANDKFTFDGTNGRLGIGTTSPDTLLHVHHDTATSIFGEADDNDALVWVAELKNSPNPTAPTTFGAGLKLSLSNGTGNELLKWAGMAAVKSPDLNYSRKVDAAFYTQTDAGNGVAPTEKMRITGDGNVGIGTTSPETLLDLDDDTYPKMRFSRANSYWWEIGHTSSDFRFTSQTGGTIMHMNYDGNVGIGNTSPDTNLHVEDDSTGLKTLLLIENTGSAGDSGTLAGLEIRNSAGTPSSTHIEQDAFGLTRFYTGQAAKNLFLTAAADGSLTAAGSFTATTKSFDIEHPTKEGKRLHHGSLEGPEHGVYHRGVGISRVVDLPDYWTGLVDEDSITVQLTPRGGFQSLYVSKIEGNRVYVDSDHGGPLDFYFNVYGERKDVDKMVVEY